MPKYLSGRVKRTPQGSLTTDRYQYLGLDQAEPNLGDPPELDAIPGGQQYQIVSLISNPGERFWVPIGGGIQPGSITVRDGGLVVPRTDANPNLGVSSITDINFVGTAVTVVGSINPDGGAGIAVTVTVAPPGDNFQILFNNIDDQFGASPNFVFDNTIGIGSVGIGTSLPTQNLHVVGNVKLDKTIYGEDNQPGTTGDLLVKTATGGVKWTDSGSVTSGAGGTITQIQFHDDTGLVGGASNFVFDSTNSRIGIGSTQPDRLLDVLGDSRFTGVTTFSGDVKIDDSLDVDGHTELDNLNVAGVSTFNDDVIFAGNNHNIKFDKSIDDLIFDDNAKLTFGIGNTTVNLFYKPDTRDFRHEFNGGANYVLLTNTFDLKSADASKAAITAYAPGGVPEVRLFNDGNEKLRTTGYGVTVFGQLETTDIFASGDVGIGTTNPTASNIESALENNTKVLAVGILTANQIFGKVTSIQETIDLDILNVSGITSTKNLLVTGIATFEQNVSFQKNVSIGGTLTYEDVTNIDSVGLITARSGIHVTGGSVGIGTTNPTHKLDVKGDINFNNNMLISNAEVGNSGNIDHIWHSDAGNYGTGGTWNFVSDGTAKREGNSAIQIGFLKSSGGGNFLESVGIGTTNPGSLLTLDHATNPAIQFRDSGTKVASINAEGTQTNIASFESKDLVFAASTSSAFKERLRITSAGLVGIGTDDPSNYGGAVKLALHSTGNTGLTIAAGTSSDSNILFADGITGDATYRGNIKYAHDDDSMRFHTAAEERLRITSDGFVGIGTTNNIEAPLHVTGANSRGIVALFGAKDFVDNVNYNYDDATIGLQGENPSGTYQGSGVQYITRNIGLTNWHHGYTTFDRVGDFHIGLGGFGTTKATDKITILSTGDVGIGTTNPERNLHVKSTTPYIRVESGAANQPATLELYHTRGNGSDKWPVSVATDDAALTFNVATAANGSPAEKVRIASDGLVTITGNLTVNGNLTYDNVTNIDAVGVITAQNGISVLGVGITVTGISTFYNDVDFNSGIGIGKSIFHIGDEGTRMQFPTTNSNGGSGQEIVFEANNTERLLINSNGVNLRGSTLSGNNTSVNYFAIQSTDGNSNRSQIDIGIISGNDGGGIHFYTTGDGNVDTEKAKRMVIKGKTGNIGIGTEDPDNTFTVKGNGSGVGIATGNFVGSFTNTGTGSTHHGLTVSTASSTSTLFSATADGGEKFRIDSNGTVAIGTGGKLTIKPNPLPTFGVSEAIRIDQNNATDDRALQVFEFENSLARHHALTHNLKVYRYSASAYGYTQGKYSGSQMHEYAGGTYKIFTNPQASVGNTQDIVPTERFRLTSSGDVGIGTNNPTGSSAVVSNSATLAVGILTAKQIFGNINDDQGDLTFENLKVTGVSTFVGVSTFGDVGIGGSLPNDFLTNKFVVGDGGGSRGMTIYSDGTLGQIYFADGNSGDNRKRGGIVYDHSENELKFSVNAVEKLVIDSDGKVGIGTDDPDELLHLESTASTVKAKIESTATNSYPTLRLKNDAREYDLQVDGATDAFRVYDVTATAERLRITSDGDVTTTGAAFNRANAGFTARKDDSVNITRASGTPLEINRTGNDGNLINFFQDGTEEANISISGDDLIFGNTTEKFRINSGGAKVTGNLEVTGVLTYEDVTNIDAVGVITAQSGINVTGGGIDVINSTGIRVSGVSTFNDNVNFQDRVLVGVNTEVKMIGVVGYSTKLIQVVGAGDSTGVDVIRFSNDDAPPELNFGKSRGSIVGNGGIPANSTVKKGDTLGRINFQGADSSTNTPDLANVGARIDARVTDTVTASAEYDMPASLFFITSAGDGATLTEKMVVHHDGKVGIGTTIPAYNLDLGESSSTIRLVSEDGGTAIRIGPGGGSNDVTLLRVDGETDNHDGESNNSQFGFSLKYMGSRSGNDNSFSLFADNQQGTQFEAITVLQDGKVGIKDSTPSYELEVNGTVAATNFDSLSDRRHKTNIQVIENPIEKIKKIDGVSFDWKKTNEPSLGVIADNVLEVLPEIVSGEDTKSVNYNGLIGVLIEVVKDQQKQIDELRGLIDK